MSRLQLKNRTTNTINTNIGKVLLFCEGKTEEEYFEYFAGIINNKPNKYNNIVIKTLIAAGNARTVLNFANNILRNSNSDYYEYEKYLIFDCDAPKDIQNVIIESIKNINNYKLLISYKFFETWLLMHFEDINSALTKTKTYEHLSLYLGYKYEKAKAGIIREIISKGDILKAISFAKLKEIEYNNLSMNIETDITKMNPFSNVYLLIEELLNIIS